MLKTKNDEYYVLCFKNEYNETQYIKSYNYKNINRPISNHKLQYKTYVYLTKSLEEAKIWKKKNGAFRMCKNVIAPTLNIPFESISISSVSKQKIRRAKILELGLLD